MAKRKKRIGVIDSETDPFKEGRIPEPFIWGFYSLEHGQLFFKTTESLMEFISTLSDYIIYAHNGGKFDFHFMLEYIEDWKKITIINNRLVAWKYSAIEFRDSYAILPIKLETYAKTKVDYNIFEKELRDLPHNAKIIADYLADDCKNLFELVSTFIEDYGLHLTIASAAIKKIMEMEDLEIPNSGVDYYNEISPYYYGGRVQCFHKGILPEKVQVYDINSAYPRAMLDLHPIETYFITTDKKPEIVGSNFYTVECISKGALPFRDENKNLVFPNDNIKRKYYATGWELLAGIELKLITHLKHIEQKVFPVTKEFSTYVNHFYTIKATSKKGTPDNINSKLFLNGGYGKFAANPLKYRTFRIISMDDMESATDQGYYIHGVLEGRLIISIENTEEHHRFYNVATGASITGWVRAFLLRSLNKVEKPYYCDTDSIIFAGNHDLEVGDDIGQWKHEGDFDIGGIGGKKLYAMKNIDIYEKELKKGVDELENKGIKRASKGLILNYDDIIKVCNGEKITKTPDNPIFSIKKGKYFLKKTIAMT